MRVRTEGHDPITRRGNKWTGPLKKRILSGPLKNVSSTTTRTIHYVRTPTISAIKPLHTPHTITTTITKAGKVLVLLILIYAVPAHSFEA